MFKPATVTIEAITKAKPPMPIEDANNVFKVMHGFYGNLFLSKFSTGEPDGAGGDAGLASARQIWAYGLREFDAATVKTALTQCLARHPEYPPSLPQFVALCAASQPRETYRPEVPEIGMGQALRSQYARQAREIHARHAGVALRRRTGYVELAPGLPGLKQAIAQAVAEAGGDEVAELLRLDRMLAAREESPTRQSK